MKPLLNARIVNLNLLKTIADINDLKYREEVELLPTEYARNMAIAIATAAYRCLPDYFFRPWLSGDDLGGVRLVWSRSSINDQVRLVAPPISIVASIFSAELEKIPRSNIMSAALHWLNI